MEAMPQPAPTHVVRLTPPGRGAIATVLVEGPQATRLVAAAFRPSGGKPLASYPGDRPVFGQFGSSPAEGVVVHRRSEESVEVHCHGGHAAVERIERMLVEQGARPTTWQQWATDEHRDPIAAAARVALADARTERTAAILLDQFHGALSNALEAIRESLRADDATEAARQVQALLARAGIGRHLVEPWRVVLAGLPNVGKSSLINALVGYRRAIVHPRPGTTRDVLTATTALDGWPVELSDTAGLCPGSDALEQAGVERAQRKLAAADLVVLVFDSSRCWSDADRALAERYPAGLVVHNKSDLPPVPCRERPPGLSTSALTGEGVEALAESIARRLVPNPPGPGDAVPFTPEQVEWLRSGAAAISQGDGAAAATILAAL